MAKSKKCSNCKHKLSIVDSTISPCSGCSKKYCIKCIQMEKHNCDNSNNKQMINKNEKIVPTKIEKL